MFIIAGRKKYQPILGGFSLSLQATHHQPASQLQAETNVNQAAAMEEKQQAAGVGASSSARWAPTNGCFQK